MDWESIREEWESSEITLKELAAKHGVSESTMRSRKNREKWSRNATPKNATQRKNVATPKKQTSRKQKASEEVEHDFSEGDDLTDKQRLFVGYYVKYWNATKAYLKAYDCAYTTAMVEGSRHLRNPKIKQEIVKARDGIVDESLLSFKVVLQKYMDIAFADLSDFVTFGKKQEVRKIHTGFDEEGNPEYAEKEVEYNYVDFKNDYEVDGTIITEVKLGKEGISLKLADKMKALDMLAKYTDLLSENELRRLQEERTKVEIETKLLEQEKLAGPEEDEYEDDGFMEALDRKEMDWGEQLEQLEQHDPEESREV